jgi:hypothetical protein
MKPPASLPWGPALPADVLQRGESAPDLSADHDTDAIEVTGEPASTSRPDPGPERTFPPRSGRNRKQLAFKAKGDRKARKHERGGGYR